MKSRTKVENAADLSLAYTPGVAAPCLEIEKDVSKSFLYTNRHNTVAVITDGTAVLGLGDIGPEAAMPVMEGKCVLFKEFGGIDALPLCIRSKSVDEIVSTVKNLLGSFGGVNLEDISAPRCFEIERKLKEISDIPIFHDDQHGTAIVVLAAIINALKIVKKDISKIRVLVNGAGAAGVAVTRLLLLAGVKDVLILNSKGIVNKENKTLNDELLSLAPLTNKDNSVGTLSDGIVGCDVFIGVSAPNILTAAHIKTMAKDPVVFALANPVPEIMPDEAKKAGVRIIGTGRSDFPNQINNVLAFPGVFRGALDAKAKQITEEMKLSAAYAIAALISENELNEDYIIPNPFDERVCIAVAKAVYDEAVRKN